MYRIAAIALIVLAIVGGIYYKIDTLNDKIDQLTIDLNTANSDIENYKLKLALKKGEVLELTTTIDKQNSIIASNEIDIEKAIKKLNEWSSKPPEVKYEVIYKYINNDKVDYAKATCEEGLELNRIISEIDYDKDIRW